MRNRLAAVITGLVLVVAACGDDATSTVSDAAVSAASTRPADEPPDVAAETPTSSVGAQPASGESVKQAGGAWELSEPPEGFVPVMVTDRNDRKEIYYQSESNRHDLYDSPIILIVSTDTPGPVELFPGASAVSVNGLDGFNYELHSDGDHYGSAVVWQDAEGRWVTLVWSELVPVDDVIALARTATPIDTEAWELLRRTLGSDLVITGESDDHVEYVVARGESTHGTPFRLAVLVPEDYPLSDNDRRLSCYRLDLDDQPGDVHCDTHPWWTRVGEDTFVYGTSNPMVSEITVTRIGTDERPRGDTPLDATTVTAPVAAPVAFYVVELPDWCWVHITAGDGVPDDRLGPIGPLPSSQHHSRCLTE